MPVFVWKGRTVGGEIQSGELTLESQDEVLAALRKKRIIITSVREKPKEIKIGLPKIGTGVSTRDLAIFTRQFATMINAGLPLVQCLDILSKQTEKEGFRTIIAQTMREVEAGTTLAEALAKKENNGVFDELFVNMVEAARRAVSSTTSSSASPRSSRRPRPCAGRFRARWSIPRSS